MYQELRTLLEEKRSLEIENRELEKRIVTELEKFIILFEKYHERDDIYYLRDSTMGRPILIKFNITTKKILKMHPDSSLVTKHIEKIITTDLDAAKETYRRLEKLAKLFNWSQG